MVLMISPAILYYDYLLTFCDEVALFWSMQWRTRTGFFIFVNRYVPLVFHALIFAEFFADMDETVRLMHARAWHSDTDFFFAAAVSVSAV